MQNYIDKNRLMPDASILLLQIHVDQQTCDGLGTCVGLIIKPRHDDQFLEVRNDKSIFERVGVFSADISWFKNAERREIILV